MTRTLLALALGTAMVTMLPGCGGGSDAPDAPSASDRRPPPENPRPAPGPSGGLTPDDTRKPGSGGG